MINSSYTHLFPPLNFDGIHILSKFPNIVKLPTGPDLERELINRYRPGRYDIPQVIGNFNPFEPILIISIGVILPQPNPRFLSVQRCCQVQFRCEKHICRLVRILEVMQVIRLNLRQMRCHVHTQYSQEPFAFYLLP